MFGIELGCKLRLDFLECLRIALFGQFQLDLPDVVLILLEIVHNYYSNHQMEDNTPIASSIPKEHPYHHLLIKHAEKYENIFQVLPTDLLKEPAAPFPLKIYGRQNVQGFGATFIYFCKLPISAQDYLQIMQNYALQKKLDPNIDEFKIHKQINEKDTELLYISYKRILIIMPRYFIYVRYTLRINGQIWVIAVSDPDSQIIKEKTKGQIILTVVRIKDVEGGCELSVYSQIDMKMKLKFQMALNSGSTQLAKYLKNVYNEIKGK